MGTSPIPRPSRAAPQRRPGRSKPASLTLFPTAARCGNGEPESVGSAPPPAAGPSNKLATELVGIARLAAFSPRAEAKRGIEYFLLPVRSILNHCHSERVPFRWTANPYRGCEFGCRYCYARYTHEYMDLDGAEFETKIYVKQDAGRLVERDLSCCKVWGEHIAIGTATDPYQPAEREFGATRAILEKMAEREGLSLSITTKSDQVLRDIDLLERISVRSSLAVNLSITTLRTRLARALEPRAPRPDLRLETVRKLRAAGIAAGVFAMPILPGLTDHKEDLDALARGAQDAGAQWFAANVLFLMPASLKQFLPFLEQKFPKLVQRYQSWYGHYGNAPETYRREIASRVEGLRRKYDLGSRPPKSATQTWRSTQLPLTWENGDAAHEQVGEKQTWLPQAGGGREF
jgi:DNA repair photolyase